MKVKGSLPSTLMTLHVLLDQMGGIRQLYPVEELQKKVEMEILITRLPKVIYHIHQVSTLIFN